MNLLSSAPSDFTLPLALADGLVLSGIELECQGCQRSYRLTRGQGHASARGRRIALAARAACPHCALPAHFLVVVDAQQATAHVQRVSRLGLWLAQWAIALRGRGPAAAAPADAPEPVVWQRSEVTCSTESLGSFLGQPIPATIRVGDRECQFMGIAHGALQDGALKPGEHLLLPGLLYREVIDLRA